MDRDYPVIWIVGATRSSKSYLAQGIAEGGRASMGFKMISTSDYFREKFGQEDTFSRDYVFNLSAFAAKELAEDPECNINFLREQMDKINETFIIEGERNPFEFSKLYKPEMDMVFFLDRQNMEVYKTQIEAGIPVIENMVRWSIGVETTPKNSVVKFTFGDGYLKSDHLSTHLVLDEEIAVENVGERTTQSKYPYIHAMIMQMKKHIAEFGIEGNENNAPSAQVMPLANPVYKQP